MWGKIFSGVTAMKKILKIFLISLFSVCMLLLIAWAGINIYIVSYAKPYIITEEEAENLDKDCVIALGAQVLPDGTPCHQLYDRVQIASQIFNNGAGKKLLLSGDSRIPEEYDEITAMKEVAYEYGIEEKDILSDGAGLNTYTSMENLKNNFGFSSTVIVTQEYHIYRSVYIARKMGLDAYGVCSDPRGYATIVYNEARETLARCKDFLVIQFDN